MPGLSPIIPLVQDPKDGFGLNKTIGDVGKQNLKMLLLTSPGERIMEPEFGVGFRRSLFENANEIIFEEIRERIFDQVSVYLPYVKITNLQVLNIEDANLIDTGAIKIRIRFFVENDVGEKVLELTV